MIPYDVVIVGGGLGGLSAGALLARHGKKVLLLEQHYIPGGCATTFKRRDFVMEAGLHSMDGHLINSDGQRSLLHYLGIKQKVEFVRIPEFFHMKRDAFDFTFPSGIKAATEHLVKEFPDEEKGIRKYFSTLTGVQNELGAFPRTFWKKMRLFPLFPFTFPMLFRTFNTTAGKFLDKHIGNEELKLILLGNLLYYHDDPYSMSMVFFAKAQASFIQHGSYFVHGGSQKLSDALAESIREKGGSILLGKRVVRLLIDGGRVSGVAFRDAYDPEGKIRELMSKHVIHSGAVPLLQDLLPEPEARKIRRKTSGMKAATSLMCVYLGFKEDISSLKGPYYSTFIVPDSLNSLDRIRENYHGPMEERSFVFVDYGQVDAGLAPKGKSFGVICTADSLEAYEGMDEDSYGRRKEEIADILIGRLEEQLPGIRACIDTYEVATARTIRRYTLNPAGAPYGYAQTPKQVGWKRPAYRSPVKNLWLSGTWTFPGGGFTGALVSGFLCGLKVSKALGNKGISRGEGLEDDRKVKLLSRKETDSGLLELQFEKPSDFRYRAGQYATIILDHSMNGTPDLPHRPLSMVSHPEDKDLRFIMRLSDSAFKKACQGMKEGDMARIFGPEGHFTLSENPRGIVFLAGGIGITPVLPMLRELQARSYAGPVYLFYSNRMASQAICESEIHQLSLPSFAYFPVLTGQAPRINEGLLRSWIRNPESMEYYMVGSRSFLHTMKEILKHMQIPEAMLHQDDFG